jgi:hypothetical protein
MSDDSENGRLRTELFTLSAFKTSAEKWRDRMTAELAASREQVATLTRERDERYAVDVYQASERQCRHWQERAERAEAALGDWLVFVDELLSRHLSDCGECSADGPCVWVNPIYVKRNRAALRPQGEE